MIKNTHNKMSHYNENINNMGGMGLLVCVVVVGIKMLVFNYV